MLVVVLLLEVAVVVWTTIVLMEVVILIVIIVVVVLFSIVIIATVAEIAIVLMMVVWAVLFESLLNLVVAILILLGLECELHHFWVDGVTWLSQFVIFMSKVTFITKGANLMRLIMSTSLSFILVIDFIQVCTISVILLVTHVIHLIIHRHILHII
jgi:hypothetical protein